MAIALLTSGCCLGTICDECPFPIIVYVTEGGSGELLGEDQLTVDAPTCGSSYWRVDHLELGCPLDEDHEITLSADGYSDETLTVSAESTDNEGCCACGYLVSQYDVELSEIPEDSG